MKKGLLTLFLCLTCVILKASEPLFFISRSLNKNCVNYDVNLVNGKLNKSNPIHVYWHNIDGSNNELNYIQNKFAYGYKTSNVTDEMATITLKAYNKRKLTLKEYNGKWSCIVLINGTDCKLNEIYVKVNPKNSLSVEYIVLKGTSILTGNNHQEIIKNDNKSSVDIHP
ncbi:MAG: DUF4833 domain-containing protein [Bacteroidales bacterium]|nr:DUF4833 domain-containing protein [Bacteroidales bacterium]